MPRAPRDLRRISTSCCSFSASFVAGTTIVREVGPVEAGDDRLGISERKLAHNVAPHFGRRRRGSAIVVGDAERLVHALHPQIARAGSRGPTG